MLREPFAACQLELPVKAFRHCMTELSVKASVRLYGSGARESFLPTACECSVWKKQTNKLTERLSRTLFNQTKEDRMLL